VLSCFVARQRANIGRIMRTKLGLVVAGTLLTIAATPLVAEDLTIVFKETGGNGATTTAQYYTSAKMRHNQGDHDSIVEYATGKIISIDNKKKEYWEATAAEFEAQMKKMNAQMEQMNAQMANMPPAVREKMEQMMGGGGAVTVTKGGTKKIAGYDAQQYTVTLGQMMTMETWNTTALKLPVPEIDVKRFASLASSSSMAAMANNPMFKSMAKVTEEMKKIEGIALATNTTVKMMGKSNVTSREATEVKQGPVPDSVFAIPADYKKVDSPLAKMGK
jgi:DNA-binding protein YbaB